MSEASPDLKEQLARIDLALAQSARAHEETRKFVDEQHKLMAESAKLAAEQQKLAAEAIKFGAETGKLRMDRYVAPLLAAAAVGGAIGAVLVKVFGS